MWFGDVDQSGALSASDVREVLLYTIGKRSLSPEERAAADCNEDFALDTADARSILELSLYEHALRVCPTLSASDRALMQADDYNGEAYIVLNGNQPLFTDKQKTRQTAYEEYAVQDSFDRCGAAYAALCRALMPTEERESISSVIPTGWHNRSYDCVPGGWVYNRAHLIGFQLAGEQANTQNLITGTRYLNASGMLPFENAIAAYIEQTDHHVLYRVTPRFSDDDLLCEGVEIEAWSVEDGGEGICLHVFCYNVQPGVIFDYQTGENRAEGDAPSEPSPILYILNTASKKFHLATCGNAASIAAENRAEFEGHREELIEQGYTPCGNCDP
ncbi:MAG: DNA/RNA non-specific endonuclease [Clostridia bacterium]|nr:DNA/RNA non-specific endonuclease [Clostridia bacterium]